MDYEYGYIDFHISISSLCTEISETTKLVCTVLFDRGAASVGFWIDRPGWRGQHQRAEIPSDDQVHPCHALENPIEAQQTLDILNVQRRLKW
jgi:hypothetical protein